MNIITHNNKDLNQIKKLEDFIIKNINNDIEYIDTIYFESKYTYGKRIKKINPNDGFTKTKTHIGVAKTMKNLNNKKSNIIIRKEFFNLNSIFEPDNLHIIFHEIGHAVYSGNINCIEENIINNINNLKFEQYTKDFLIPYIINEYNAEKYAIKKLLKNNINYINEIFNDNNNISLEYQLDINKLLKFLSIYSAFIEENKKFNKNINSFFNINININNIIKLIEKQEIKITEEDLNEFIKFLDSINFLSLK